MPEDTSAREWARTRTSDATTPPPPPDQAVTEAVQQAPGAADASLPAGPSPGAQDRSPVSRLPLLVQALLAGLVAGALAVASLIGLGALVAVVVVVQAVLVVAVLALLDAPAARGAAVVAGVSAVAADVLVVVDDGSVDRLVGVVGLALVASLLHQLVRRGRSRVTESLADTSLAVLTVTAAACLPAVELRDGRLLLVVLAVAAAALLAGRAADQLRGRPALVAGSTRGWPGLVLSALVGTGVALLLADLDRLDLPLPAAALLGLVVVATVSTVDLAVDVGASELRPGRRDARRVRAVLPAAALLPFALLGPVALLAGRLVLT